MIDWEEIRNKLAGDREAVACAQKLIKDWLGENGYGVFYSSDDNGAYIVAPLEGSDAYMDKSTGIWYGDAGYIEELEDVLNWYGKEEDCLMEALEELILGEPFKK